MTKLNLDFENTYNSWNVSKNEVIDCAEKIFNYYMSCPEILHECCLKDYNYSSVAFDFLLCSGTQTHEINKEYRNKDYPADIITFAVFADSPEEERFVLDFEINLGEIIIALDKITEQANEKGIDKNDELKFFISHGILHLLGFDHQTEDDFEFVVNHQKAALKSIGINYDKI
ncbi:rRNA maturation RNase YbeY [bacterium]|nr:rRNA maturation RNase YbeY [bacterium]